jgi:uncharacterized protein YodC (DUF2158 family)
MLKIKVGDVVKLKSGGPLMTIERKKGNYFYCVWFNGPITEYIYRDKFHILTLKTLNN